MAPVISAILAAFLAGGIALFRERRLEARRLRIAARVVQATIFDQLKAVVLASEGKLTWQAFELAAERENAVRTWNEHRDVLAGHLSRDDWNAVQKAIRDHLAVLVTEQNFAPDDPKWTGVWAHMTERLAKAVNVLDPFAD